MDISDWGSPWTPNIWVAITKGASINIALGAAHPITAGLPASWAAHGYWSYGDVANDFVGWSTDTTLPSLAAETSVANQSRVLVANSLGNGREVYVGWNVYGSNAGPNDLTLLRNAILWAGNALVTAPIIVTQPASQTNQCGSNVTFTVAASSIAPLSYQWYYGTSPLTNGPYVSGATNATLTLSNASFPEAGGYSVVLTNMYGSVTSQVAALTIIDTIPPVVTLNGPSTVAVVLHGVFDDPGATAYDTCAGYLLVYISGAIDVDALGTYTFQYWATDPSGNSATNYRTVYVVAPPGPLLAPRLSANGGFSFSMATTNGQNYTIQQSTNLLPDSWTFYSNFTGNGAPIQMIAPATNGPQLFFRVTEP